jgi:hypothetical protein
MSRRTPMWYHACIGTPGDPLPLPVTTLVCPDCGIKKTG